MKKLFMYCLFILSISPLLALAGVSTPVKADDVIYSPVVPTVTPALTDTEVVEHDTALYVTELLRQGGYIDFSNVSDDYGFSDFVDDFLDSLDSLFTGKRYTTKEELSARTLYNLTTLGLQFPIEVMRNTMIELSEDDDDPSPTPTPPVDYEQIVDYINGSGFFWKDYPTFNNVTQDRTYTFINNVPPWKAYSYVKTRSGYLYQNSATHISACEPITISVIKNGDTYSYTQNVSIIDNNVIRYDPMYNQNQYFTQFTFENGVFFGCNFAGIDNVYTKSGTLSQVLTHISQNFRNVVLYVDGDLWSMPFAPVDYYWGIGNGTYIEGTDYPVQYDYPVEVYVDVDDIIDKIQEIIDNKEVLKFEDISNLIVDVNGQPAVSVVTVFNKDNIDDYLVKNFGALIPIFPVNASFPVSIDTVASIVTIPIAVIPSDILEVLRYIFFGTLLVCLLQRLLE